MTIPLNPFLIDIPVVLIVTQTRITANGAIVETPLTACTRVWGRLNSSWKLNEQDHDLIPDTPKRLIPSRYGLDNIKPF